MTREEKIQELMAKTAYNAADLVKIVELLRLPGGCPWDREQTHISMRNDLIEETYEVIEAIDKKDATLLTEELGDLLLQIVMHARIEEEEGRSDFDKVADGVCRKMIHRHPHVFGTVKADTTEEVLSNWEAIKSEEKSRRTVTDKLRAIPRQLPALMRAAKVGKKAKGMDFPDAESALLKLREETDEVVEAMGEEEESHLREEVGDLLFSAANLARKLGVEPEEALNLASDKFISRYERAEQEADSCGTPLDTLSQGKKDKIWEKVKKK